MRPDGPVLVIGTGASGRAAVAALVAAGVEVRVTDEAGVPDPDALPGATVLDWADPSALLEGVRLVVPSPGVPEHAPMLLAAAAAGVPVWSEPELGLRLHPRRLLAVTGTNGKTSTTELLTAMLVEGDVDAHACGNIGRTVTETAAGSDPAATLVAELSSFQLRFCSTVRPEVGVLLNVADDHLDWHRDRTAYADAKARIWRAQAATDWAVVPVDDPDLVARASAAPGRLATFSGGHRAGGAPGVGVVDGRLVASGTPDDGPVVDVADLASDAPHVLANTAAAATAALLAGVPRDAVGRAARTFRPGRHRLEVVHTAGGVTWVDDSKATNPHAAAAALASYPRIVWLAGGLAKGVDLSVLSDALGAVRHAVLFGASAGELAAVCDAGGVAHTTARSMEEAVAAAAAVARAGDTVLLAPACASFDMFHDYADRGDRFAAAARTHGDGRDHDPAPGDQGATTSSAGPDRTGANA